MKGAIREAYRRFLKRESAPRLHPMPPEWRLDPPFETEKSSVWQYAVWIQSLMKPVTNCSYSPKQIHHSVASLPVSSDVRDTLVQMRQLDPESRPCLPDAMEALKRSADDAEP